MPLAALALAPSPTPSPPHSSPPPCIHCAPSSLRAKPSSFQPTALRLLPRPRPHHLHRSPFLVPAPVPVPYLFSFLPAPCPSARAHCLLVAFRSSASLLVSNRHLDRSVFSYDSITPRSSRPRPRHALPRSRSLLVLLPALCCSLLATQLRSLDAIVFSICLCFLSDSLRVCVRRPATTRLDGSASAPTRARAIRWDEF